MIRWIKKETKLFIIAGNVARSSAAKHLWEAGADVVKAGVGGGSLCSTRIKTGNGVPMISTLIDIHNAKQEMISSGYKGNLYFISDGGSRSAGDLVKSFCFADMVMAGSIFAGLSECPGNTFEIDGILHKEYAGSSTHKSNYIEGVKGLVPCKGKYIDILTEMLEGVRSGMSYQGAHNLTTLKNCPEFIRITHAGIIESHPHDIKVIK